MKRVDAQQNPARTLSPAPRYLGIFVLIAATLVVYSPVSHHSFSNLDDRGYVVNNFHVQQLNWDTVKWSFTTFHASNWHPVTWLSHALDYHWFGLDAARHHEVNVLLHALNAALLFWVLAQATSRIGCSFAVAALFALHPINVETVAWIAERKSLLSMFFFLLTLGAYRWYAQRPRADRYPAVVVLFALGLMSKPQIITLPFVLLLWDYWPLGRMFAATSESSPIAETTSLPPRSIFWLLIEKLPLLALSVASAVVTLLAQRAGGTIGGALNTYTFSSRLSNAIVAYVRYMGDAIWPKHLAFFYPHARFSPPLWQVAAAFGLLLILTVWTIASRKRRYLAVGWLWFVGTLVPMIGLVQVGSQAMADRYAYLPLVGLFIAVCWGIADWAERWHFAKLLLPAGMVAILLLLSLAARRQIGYWINDLTLWEHSADVVQNNWMAENMIGETLLRDGSPEDAIAHFRAAAQMEPLFAFSHLHIGIYEEEHRHPQAAIEQFQRVVDITQNDTSLTRNLRESAFAHMSFAYNQLGDYANQQKYLDLAAQMQQP
jgi:hypothetical protein